MSPSNIARQCRKYKIPFNMIEVSTKSASGYWATVEKIHVTKELIQKLIDTLESSDKKKKNGYDNTMMIDNMIKSLVKYSKTIECIST